MAELRDLVVQEVSLLFEPKQPANKRAVLLMKSADKTEGGDMAEMPAAEIRVKLDDEVAELLGRALSKDDSSDAVLDELLARFDEAKRPTLKVVAKILRAVNGETPEMKALLEALGMWPDHQQPGDQPSPEDMMPNCATPDDTQLAKSAGEYAIIEKSDGSFDLSGVPEEKRDVVELLWKERKRAFGVEAELNKARMEKKRAEFLAKAEEMKALGAPEKIAAVLLKLSDNECLPEVEGMLRQAAVLIGGSNSLAEIGSAQRPSASGDPMSQLDAMAAELVRKSEGKLTKQEAMLELFNTTGGKEAYGEYHGQKRRS